MKNPSMWQEESAVLLKVTRVVNKSDDKEKT